MFVVSFSLSSQYIFKERGHDILSVGATGMDLGAERQIHAPAGNWTLAISLVDSFLAEEVSVLVSGRYEYLRMYSIEL
jgi:hypothetical protein